MNFPLFEMQEAAAFVMVLMRVSVVLFMFPVFGSNLIPISVKAGLSMVLAMFLTPLVPVTPQAFPDNIWQAGLMLLSEAVIGLTLSLVVSFFFAAVQVGGQMVGYQMGFAIANVFDPASGGQMSILANFGFWMTLVLFLILDGHHLFVKALVESFHLIPVGVMSAGQSLVPSVIALSSSMFTLGVQLSAPAIVALLLTNAAFGIVAKVAPQINILIVAFPINVGMGLVFFGVSLQLILVSMRSHMVQWADTLRALMTVFGG